MALLTDESKFEKYKNNLQKKAQDNQNKSNRFNDGRFITFESGKTYKFRLIYYENENSDRDGPFIEKFVHSSQDQEGAWSFVTCPTTFYPSTGFDKCKVCENNHKLYNSGSETDKELYYMHRRRFNGYGLVYVVNDPTTPENNDHIKILRYGKTIRDWLNKEVFGIQDSDDDDDFDPVGYDAFKLEDGYDLIISVSTTKTDGREFPKYTCKFARKSSDVDVDEDKLEAEIEELNFDKELTKSTEKEILRYFKNNVLDMEVVDDEESETVSDDVSDIVSEEVDEVEETSKSEVESEEVSDSTSLDDVTEEDIDKIIEEIENESV